MFSVPPLIPVEVRIGGRPSGGIRLDEVFTSVDVPHRRGAHASWKKERNAVSID